ncbi:histidine phosphatase family protein [Paracoccus sp. Z330]|uniref:Histidine phosphatase family protein n=1 Tax=Paracoccus onchidii TaxID=3017813 RepID=A0ABT4ZEU5_9RHOB|nr:histidine phosphatase family protein [Paracoccus onchidii]MDB6177861.1 histidine phosphatase family protein [Paracoccus onchidii]
MKLQILRHAPALTQGRLAGRTDVDADCSDQNALAWIADRIDRSTQIVTSPAQRCRQTAGALGFDNAPVDARFWEQDFGTWEGLPYARLPDLGPLPVAQLANHRPPGGESFHDMAERVQQAIEELATDSLLIAHAGTVRAALALVVGPAALSFSVAPLSLTVLRKSGRSWGVDFVNMTAT